MILRLTFLLFAVFSSLPQSSQAGLDGPQSQSTHSEPSLMSAPLHGEAPSSQSLVGDVRELISQINGLNEKESTSPLFLSSPLSCPSAESPPSALVLLEKENQSILSEIQSGVTGKSGCSKDPSELRQKMVQFLTQLDRDQNSSKVFSADVQKNRKDRFNCLKGQDASATPSVSTLFTDAKTVTANSVSTLTDSLAQCSGSQKGTEAGAAAQDSTASTESIALDSIATSASDTPLPAGVPPEVRSVYQDIFKAMDHARNTRSTPPYTVNLLVPGNNDLSNAAYVAQQALALKEYAKLHPTDRIQVRCITMGFGGYPTTAEFKNTMAVSKDPKGALIRDKDGHPTGTGIPEAEALARVIKNMSDLECDQERYSTTTAENVLKVNSLLSRPGSEDASQVFFLSGAKTGSGRQADIFANNLDPKIGQLYSLPMRRSPESLSHLPAKALAYHYFNGLKEVFGDYICQFQNCGGQKDYSLIGVKPMTPQFSALIQTALNEVSCFTQEETKSLSDRNVNEVGALIDRFKNKLQDSIPKAFDEKDYSEEIARLGKDPKPILAPILR